MLIQFSVKNYRSIRDTQSLSLVMAKGDELEATNTFDANAPATSKLLRAAVIYGANAAGKSNLLGAIKTMKLIVLDSASKRQQGEELPVTPFRLNSETASRPSEFEVIFVAKGVRYQYGFSVSKIRVHEEWLIAFPNGRPQRWFSRTWDESKELYSWEMGPALLGQKQLWQDSTRDNALFLSTAVQLNSKQLQPVFDWFSSVLKMTGFQSIGSTFTASLCKDADQRSKVLEFLRAADLDIQDVKVTAERMTEKHLPPDIPESIKKKILDDLKGKELYDIKTLHRTSDGMEVEFNFDEESDGTQKLFAFAGPWLDVLNNGYVLFVDELHDNLHPKLVRFLIELFQSNTANQNNAQLVFTTHETSILNQDVFRRDQIWFCEKDADQATRIYPLTDFSPRKGRENLEAAYLAGRYGALPYVRALRTHQGA